MSDTRSGDQIGPGERRRLIGAMLDARQQERRALAAAIEAEITGFVTSIRDHLGARDVPGRQRREEDVVRDVTHDVDSFTTRLRRLAMRVEPPHLVLERSLAAAVSAYLQRVGDVTGIEVVADVAVPGEPSHEVADACILLLQEAMVVGDAAGRTTRARVEVTRSEGGLLLRVSTADGGPVAGVEVDVARRVAFHEMQELAVSLGGWCHLDDTPHTAVIECWLPAGEPAA